MVNHSRWLEGFGKVGVLSGNLLEGGSFSSRLSSRSNAPDLIGGAAPGAIAVHLAGAGMGPFPS